LLFTGWATITFLPLCCESVTASTVAKLGEFLDLREQRRVLWSCYANGVVGGSPGPIEFEEGDTVIDIIARAGDFAKKANRKHTAILRRDTDGETVQVIVADMNAALRGSEVLLQHPVQDGDIIYVPDRPTSAWKNIVRTLTGAGSLLLVFDRLMN